MLRLMIGRAGCGKTTELLRRLVEAGKSRPQILLVPEQQSHEMERALCRAGGDGASLYGEVLSFSRLANRIFLAAGGMGEPELDQGGRVLLMHQAVQAAAGGLRVYARPSRKPAFLTALLATLDELKSGCVAPEQLRKAGEEAEGPDGDKLRDLGLICGTYDALAAQIAWDPRDRLTRAADKLKETPWAEGMDVWLDGFTDFTPQQLQLLRLLLRQAHSVTAALTCDHLEDNEGGTGIFSPARRTGASLLRLAQLERVPSQVETIQPPEGVRAPALAFLEEHLFAQKPPAYPHPAAGEVCLYSALTPRGEVERTAAEILRLVREEGLRFREIGVAARNFERYSGLIQSVFSRYGIPVFCSAMTDILEKPVLALVTAALDTLAGGYRYEDLFRYLKTGLTWMEAEDRDFLENYALKWNLYGSRWTQSKPWTMHPKGYGFDWEDEDRAALDRLNELRQKVTAPLELLHKNPVRTGRGQAMALYRFLEETGLPQQLDARAKGLDGRGELALAEEYRQLWDILCLGLEQCAQLLGDTPMELDEFSGLLRLVLSQYSVGTIPVALDQVSAGETTRQTGHRVKALFLLGADDASLPLASEPEGLLSDSDRALLSLCGVDLHQTSEELLYREMTTIYLTCAQPSACLSVSWSRQGGDGEECRPSFLVERLKLVFPDLSVVQEESLKGRFRLCAPLPALEQAGRSPAARRALAQLPDYAPALDRLAQADSWERGRLSRRAVDGLYGAIVPMSASRMDLYNSCHFSYFMRFGLEAQPRKPAGFAAPEYGTFVHYVLEHVLKQMDVDGGLGPAQTDLLVQLTDQAVEQYVREKLGGLDQQSERFRYLFHRLRRSVLAVVENMVEELAASQFRPCSFELGFGAGKPAAPIEFTANGVTIRVTGFVDRVDGWVHNGRLYLRVVDYKTGRKSFDWSDIYHGLGLQMLLYLFALEKNGETLYNQPVESAGVLYLPARDAVLKGSRTMSDEAWRAMMDKQLKRSGLVLDQREVVNAMEAPANGSYRFLPLKISKSTGTVSGEALVSLQRLGRLGEHVQRVLRAISQEIAAGNITADPFWRGEEKNACRFCDYAAACHFEEGRGGDCRRWMGSMKSNEFWQKLEEGI